jgi:hypothetical protein
MPQSIDSEDFDPEITLSRGVKVQDTMFPSESLNVVPQEEEAVSAGASHEGGTGGVRLEVSMSEAVTPGAESQPKFQPQPQPKLQPPSQAPSQPQSQPKLQAKSQPKSKLARKRRLLLLFLVVVGATLLIGPVGVFFWWQHYKTTPAYQLALLFDAVHRNDNATVDQIVVMDRITDTFASQVKQNVLSQNTSATDSERKQLESSVTGQAPSIKQMVREEVEKQVRDEAAPSAGKSLLMTALAMPYKVGIKQAGDTATVAPQSHPVAWTMQRSSGGPWAIVAVKDDALASRIQEQITSELPTKGGEKTQAGASRQKSPPASVQQKNSADSSRARKKERKKPKEGITIDLRRLPWPE